MVKIQMDHQDVFELQIKLGRAVLHIPMVHSIYRAFSLLQKLVRSQLHRLYLLPMFYLPFMTSMSNAAKNDTLLALFINPSEKKLSYQLNIFMIK